MMFLKDFFSTVFNIAQGLEGNKFNHFFTFVDWFDFFTMPR